MGDKRQVGREIAYSRAIEDYSQFSQFARLSAQFASFMNGGAAGAMLTFFSAIITGDVNSNFGNVSKILVGFSAAAGFYLFGVLCSVVAMFFFARSKLLYGHAWEDFGEAGFIDFDSEFSRLAGRWNRFSWLTLLASAVAFLVGSFCAISGIFMR